MSLGNALATLANDPSADSSTDTLLRLLLPLNAKARGNLQLGKQAS